MASLTIFLCWISILSGISQARHTSRSSSIGRIIALDPYALQGGQLIGSSASSSTSGQSSSASSSAGSTRTVSASTILRPRQLPSRRLGNVRRRPMITRVDGRPVLIIRPGSAQSLQNIAVRPSRIVQRPPLQLVRVNNPVGQATSLLDLLGLSPSAVAAPRGANLGTRPPGVSFLGSQSVGGVLDTGLYPIQYLPNSPQIVTSVTAAPVAPAAPVNTGPKSTVAGIVSRIGTTGLEAVSGTRKGEIIIRGPGGSIIIGPEILTGITKSTGGFPFISEFEEFEQEVGPRKKKNSIRLSDPGKGSIVLERNPAASSGATSSASGSSGNGVIQVLNSDPTLGASSAASSAVSTSGSASASASASAGAGGVSSASSSASVSTVGNDPVVVMGNGVMVEKANGGQVITLGKNGKQTQVITMGGAQVQIADNGSGIRAPGNATFIVKG